MATEVVEQPKIAMSRRITLMERCHRFTVEEYHRMLELEIFGPEAKWSCWRVGSSRRGREAAYVMLRSAGRSDPMRAKGPEAGGYFVSLGSPLTIRDRDSETEPDVRVLRGKIRDYTDRERRPADAALLIEVSDTCTIMTDMPSGSPTPPRGCRCTGSSTSIAAAWKFIPSRPARARPPSTPAHRSSVPTTRSSWPSTAARSAGFS